MEEALVFPNECYICKSMGELIRCRCNLISYCGDEHQRQHWSVHENFCNAIMSLLKEKGLTHIYEKLFNVFDFDFVKKREEISRELIRKLNRPMSPLEQAMFLRPRVCYVCCKVEQEELKNCPGCPVASFCNLHPKNENHSINCKIMKKYLDFLRTAGKLNIDLQFLTWKFGNLFEDLITFTLQINAEEHTHSRCMKIHFRNFISSVSKLYHALHLIHGTIPSEIVIYMDCLDSPFNSPYYFLNENYWEFLLHYNPRIKMLKIVFIGCKDAPTWKTVLCDKCRSLQKTLQIDFISMSYENYKLEKYYRKPDVVYCEIRYYNDKSDRWINSGCPVILKLDSKTIFDNKLSFLERSPDVYKIIYQGPISTEFSDISDYFVIFKKRDYFNRQQNYEIIQQIMTEYVLPPLPPCLLTSDAKNSQVSQQNTEVIERDSQKLNIEQNSKVQQNPKIDEKNSEGEQNINVDNDSKIEQNPNAGDDPKVAKQNLKVIEIGGDHLNPENGKKNSNPEEKESVSESQGEKLENQEVIIEAESFKIQDDCNAEENVDSEQKLEDFETLSTSTSSSFIVISKSPDPKSRDDFNDENKENEIFLVNLETEKIDKECPVTTCKNCDNENKSKVTESFLLKHNLFLKNENALLRKHLNCSVEEVSELQNKILQLRNVCSNLVKKNKILKEAFSDIDVDIDSALEE